jgi:hypothetical protein
MSKFPSFHTVDGGYNFPAHRNHGKEKLQKICFSFFLLIYYCTEEYKYKYSIAAFLLRSLLLTQKKKHHAGGSLSFYPLQVPGPEEAAAEILTILAAGPRSGIAVERTGQEK